MNQLINFTITEYHWYSTQLKGMAYKFVPNYLKNTSIKIGEIKYTHSITTEQQQQGPQIGSEGLTSLL